MALNIEWKKCECGWIECEFSDPQNPFKTILNGIENSLNLNTDKFSNNPENPLNSSTDKLSSGAENPLNSNTDKFSNAQSTPNADNLPTNQIHANAQNPHATPKNSQNKQNANDLPSPQNSTFLTNSQISQTNLQSNPSPQTPTNSTPSKNSTNSQVPNTFTLEISSLYCPFNDWFFALENLDKNAPPSIYIDCEGFYVQICLREPRDKRRFKIINVENGATLFECETNAQEIAQQMYAKLVAFARSERYEPRHYERVADEDGWDGFCLSRYRNPTLEHYAEFGLKIQGILYDSKGNQLTHTSYPPAANALKSMPSSAIFHFAYHHSECRFCQSEIRVKTIYDMLAKAYDFIAGNEKVREFLRKIGESKESVGICQNYSRLRDLENEDFFGTRSPYRVVQATESGVYLCFSEDFERLCRVEIFTAFFGYKCENTLETPLRNRRARHELKNDKERLEFLCEIFAVFVPFSRGLKECLGNEKGELFDTKGFLVKKEIMEQNAATPVYPPKDSDFRIEFNCIQDNGNIVSKAFQAEFFFEFKDRRKDKGVRSIALAFFDYTYRDTERPLPLSLWLNQKVISMYPDYCEAFLWDNQMCLINSSIEGYEYLEGSWLEKDGEAWAGKYPLHESGVGFDWQGFNDEGRELWRTLQEKIASKYIVLYKHGWGESEGSFREQDERNARKERKFELKICCEACLDGGFGENLGVCLNKDFKSGVKSGSTGIFSIKDDESYGKSVPYEALNLPSPLIKGFEKWLKDFEKNGEKWQNALKFCASEAEKSSLFYYGVEFVPHKKIVDSKALNGENLGLDEALKDGENELILDEILSKKSSAKSDKSNVSKRFVCNENGEFMDYAEFMALMSAKKAFDAQGLELATKLKAFLKDKAYIEFGEWIIHPEKRSR